MKSTLLALFVVAALAAETSLFNTGVNSRGNVRRASGLRPESHWEIVSITKSDTTTVPPPSLVTWTAANGFPVVTGAWLLDNGISQWILPSGNTPYGVADATYRFRTRFDLTDFDVSAATLTGRRACDDSCNKIRLNGKNPTTITNSAGFAAFTDFFFGVGVLESGVNVLTIDVVNGNAGDPSMNPVGLRVEAIIQNMLSSVDVKASMTVDFFNTGVDDMRVPLLATGTMSDPNLTPDTHYTLTASPMLDTRMPKIVQARRANGHMPSFPIPPWLADDSSSDWIGVAATPTGDIDMSVQGDYTFQLTFDMTDLALYNAKIIGLRACDDVCGAISLNGGDPIYDNKLSDPAFAPFAVWRSFVIADGFVTGTNTLKFAVTNGPTPMSGINPMGLRVEMALRATACHDCGAMGKYVSQVCDLPTFPSGQAACSSCSGPPADQYVSTTCSAGNYKTMLGADTMSTACSDPNAGQFVTAICMAGTYSMLGTNTAISSCCTPSGSQYVTSACVAGSHTMTGTDTSLATCSEPMTMQYVSCVCMSGSYSQTGTNTDFKTCSAPTNAQYVSSKCKKGSHSQLGQNTERSTCSDPGTGEYVTAVCDHGAYNMLGCDTKIDYCDGPSGSNYVTATCVAGSHLTAGSNTMFATCTAPTGNKYVTCPCMSGSYSSTGSNTVLGTCSEPPMGKYVKYTCQSGSIHQNGKNTKFATCTTCSTGELHPCKPGCYNQKGKDTVCKDPCLTNNGGCGDQTCVRTGNDASVCVAFVGAPCARDVDCPSEDLFCFNAHCFVNACRVAPPHHCSSCMPTGNKKYRCCGPDNQMTRSLFDQEELDAAEAEEVDNQ